MRSRSLSVIFLGMTLTLFLASQALGQAPIVYMFKAEFGMTPEELRAAYKEEEENHNNAWQQEMEYDGEYYANDVEELLELQKVRMEKSKTFWIEATWIDEKWYTKGEMLDQLITLYLKPLLSLEELGGWSVDFFSFGDNGLFETKTRVNLREVMHIYGKEFFTLPYEEYPGEEKSEDALEKAEKISDKFGQTLDTIFLLLSEQYGESEYIEKDGGTWWVWKDEDDNTVSLDISGFKFSDNDKEYSLYTGLTIVCSGVRDAGTITALRRYVNKPYKSPGELCDKAWEKFTTEAWGTPHPATAAEMAEARRQGEPLPPVPHKYNDWKERMETIDYNQVPDFDKPLAAFLTMGGRTIRSFGSPTDVEGMMDMPAIRANKCLQTILGLTEDIESWNVTSFKNRSFWAKFAAYLELTKSVVTSDKLKDFLFKEWLYGDLKPESETG